MFSIGLMSEDWNGENIDTFINRPQFWIWVWYRFHVETYLLKASFLQYMKANCGLIYLCI